ncbi:MAG: hypothetical protein Q8904_01890 [Bacteroidota bacterium]|nr:hypothetical protein [Bacteroidota bacterium]
MVKRQKNILIWIIIWGGLLLAVLYSPIGSPDLYTSRKYFSANQGVQFKGAEILNSPSLKSSYGNNYQELNVPVYNSSELKSNTSYSVTSSENTFNSNSGNSVVQENRYLSSPQKNGNSDASFGEVGIAMNTSKSKNAEENVNTVSRTGFMSLTTDLNNLSTSTTKQSATNENPLGGTDPGPDPNGSVIPVGDGWGLLFLLGVCYALIIIVFKKKTHFDIASIKRK